MTLLAEAIAPTVSRIRDSQSTSSSSTLQETVRRSVGNYLNDLGDHSPTELYRMVLAEVEKPLLEEVMKWSGNNQCKTAIALGISRGTLRKKLRQHGLS